MQNMSSANGGTDTKRHQPSLWKQQNKQHKSGRHRTKSELHASNKGKTEDTFRVSKKKQKASKNERCNKRRQLRAAKISEFQSTKRFTENCPVSLCIVALGKQPAVAHEILQTLVEADPEHKASFTSNTGSAAAAAAAVLLKVPRFQAHFRLSTLSFNDTTLSLLNKLDAVKSADALLFVYVPSDINEICEDVDTFLSSMFAQDSPTTHYHGIARAERLAPKARNDIKKLLEVRLEHWFRVTQETTFFISSTADAIRTLHQLRSIKPNPIWFRELRSFIAADSKEIVVAETATNVVGVAANSVILRVSGFLRGTPLNVNQIVHVVNVGDCLMSSVTSYNSPFSSSNKSNNKRSSSNKSSLSAHNQDEKMEVDSVTSDSTTGSAEILLSSSALSIRRTVKANPDKQESLTPEFESDPMQDNLDQSEITNEELAAAEAAALAVKKTTKRVPKGTSEYQAHWILDDDDDDDENDDENDDDDVDDGVSDDADAEDASDTEKQSDNEELNDGDDDADTTMNETENDDDKPIVSDDIECFKRERQQQELKYPDEIDTPTDKPARIRFIKYRPLAAFDKKKGDDEDNDDDDNVTENQITAAASANLPPEYSRIWQFENFPAMRRRILKQQQQQLLLQKKEKQPTSAKKGKKVEDMDTTAEDQHDTNTINADQFVLLEIIMSQHQAQLAMNRGNLPLLVYGLLPHEQKMSVVHLLVKKHALCSNEDDGASITIASKDELYFQVGFRRFTARPIFSQYTAASALHTKFERFMPDGVHCVATIYAPIVYPPAPVLIFKSKPGDGDSSAAPQLVATGSVLSVDPARVILKRIVLTGHLLKINKRSATVRFMFFNREDIMWYKSAPLSTRQGRKGEIIEPIGTHGFMKCRFNSQLGSQDTVMMKLYKRVFPKWSFVPDYAPASI